ncbi:MAG: TolB family protein [Solirubrobacterales bacterium]
MPKTIRFIPALAVLLVLGCLSVPAVGWAAAHRNGPIVFVGGEFGFGNDESTHSTGIWSRLPGHHPYRQLTGNPTDRDPAVSPNGRWVVFSREAGRSGSANLYAIFRMRIDGSEQTQVTPATAYDTEPAFAPSGKRILFVRHEAGESGDIYSIRLDGSGLHRLTSGPADDGSPAFSPTGRLVAFDRAVAGVSGGRRGVYVMRPNGNSQRDLTPNLPHQMVAFNPAFSPDGRRLAFCHGESGTYDLFTMRPDGSRLRRITDLAGHSGWGALSEPTFSPDGRQLLATSANGYGSELVTVAAMPNSRPHVWGEGGMEKKMPAWAPLPR